MYPKSKLSQNFFNIANGCKRYESIQATSNKRDSLILEYNANDIVSPFYIPTDLKLLQTYMKKFHQRNLLHGKGKFHVIERDYDTLEIKGTKQIAFSKMNFDDYYAVVNFAKWMADLQSNSLKNNFITLNKKLDEDSIDSKKVIDLEKNKFVGKVNLHPHISVKLTDDLLESIINELTKEGLIDNLYDISSLTEFYDFLTSDRDFFVFNYDIVLNNLTKNLFVGLPDISILETQLEHLLYKFQEYGLDKKEQSGIIYFVDQYFDQLSRINVSKEPLSDSLMSALFNFYTNTESYEDAFITLQRLLKENSCLPRPSHLLSYLTKVDDPLKLVGIVSMFQFNDIENNLFECILDKVDCFEKIKFITSINPEDFFKNLTKLEPILKKLESLNEEELDNSILYNRYLSYYLIEFDTFNKLKEADKINTQLFKTIIKSLYKVGNFFNINQYLQLAEEKGIFNDNMKNELKQELSNIIINSDTMSIEVLQNGFKEIVDQKLNL